ncbi:hypothetical protein ABZ471_10525 [Streptomyces sp. NPDC005728]|uniref:hypothetical protein n=1 Tax=Streptomyces sp. NPDC005728 TaxID=3157054 RepID=UPI0033D2757E
MSFLDKAASILAPGTLVIGLLYFFGSTYTDAYYSFFGVPPRDLQFSVQSYLASSPRAIFFPVLFLFLTGLGLAMVLLLITHALSGPRNVTRRRVVARWFMYPSMAVLLLFSSAFSDLAVGTSRLDSAGNSRWVWAPLVVALGSGLWLYGLRLSPGDWGNPDKRAPTGRRVWFTAEVLLAGLMAAALFTFATRYAAYKGKADAGIDANNGFKAYPYVLIYSGARIAHSIPGITVKDQGSGSGPYRFRYKGFVALAKTPTHFYLVSRDWHAGRAVLVLPDDGTIRAEMKPV